MQGNESIVKFLGIFSLLFYQSSSFDLPNIPMYLTTILCHLNLVHIFLNYDFISFYITRLFTWDVNVDDNIHSLDQVSQIHLMATKQLLQKLTLKLQKHQLHV